jgi:hypothetical protein
MKIPSSGKTVTKNYNLSNYFVAKKIITVWQKKKLMKEELFRRGFALLPDFGNCILELGHVLEAFVDRGKADVSDFVQAFKFAHDQFADLARVYFAFAAGTQLFFDAMNGGVHCFCRDRALAQSELQAGAQLGGVEFGAAAIFLDDDRHGQFDAFIGRKTLFALGATPAAANAVPFL